MFNPPLAVPNTGGIDLCLVVTILIANIGERVEGIVVHRLVGWVNLAILHVILVLGELALS